MKHEVTVVGAGLAGSEAAWQLAQRGVRVKLVEMKPLRRTPAQVSDHFAELVCSNSLRSANPLNAVGLIKEEMRRLGSLIVETAYQARVPAGDALAVDREIFAACIKNTLSRHPLIKIENQVMSELPDADDAPTIIATGPLTADELAARIAAITGRDRLYFYDAIAPIIAAESINYDKVFAASRYGKGEGADYLNCPLDEAQYNAFVDALLSAEYAPLHDFEEPKYFQGCLPIEVVAQNGRDSLRFGTMKPVGLRDPRSDKRSYAIIQLRKEDKDGQAFNIVGFQTKLKIPEQKRIFRMVPGLENVEFLRFGAIHRNTYLDSPHLLDTRMRLRAQPNILFAGQITGVEGYVESAAHGLLTALLLAGDLQGEKISAPPRESALGGLWAHVTGENQLPGRPHEPQNVNWSMVPPMPASKKKKDNKELRVARGRAAFEQWAKDSHLALKDLNPA